MNYLLKCEKVLMPLYLIHSNKNNYFQIKLFYLSYFVIMQLVGISVLNFEL